MKKKLYAAIVKSIEFSEYLVVLTKKELDQQEYLVDYILLPNDYEDSKRVLHWFANANRMDGNDSLYSEKLLHWKKK
jgi:hypothetical protein